MMSHWKFIMGKRIMQFMILCITLLLMFIGYGTIQILSVHPPDFLFDIDIFASNITTLVWNIYPIIICFIILTGMFGIYAIFTGKSRLMELYCTFLFIAFILNAVFGGVILEKAFSGLSKSSDKFHELMKNYDFDSEAKTTIDTIQSKGNCCGYYDPTEWYHGPRLSENLDFDDVERFYVPNSCCNNNEKDKCISKHINGCGTGIQQNLTELTLAIVIELSIISILLLLAVLTASNLKRHFLEQEEPFIFPTTLNGISMQSEQKIASSDLVLLTKNPCIEVSKA